MRSADFVLAGFFALTLAYCSDTGPTAPRGPFRLTMLTAFGSSSGPVYNGVTYQSYAYDIDPAGQVVGKAEALRRETPTIRPCGQRTANHRYVWRLTGTASTSPMASMDGARWSARDHAVAWETLAYGPWWVYALVLGSGVALVALGISVWRSSKMANQRAAAKDAAAVRRYDTGEE